MELFPKVSIDKKRFFTQIWTDDPFLPHTKDPSIPWTADIKARALREIRPTRDYQLDTIYVARRRCALTTDAKRIHGHIMRYIDIWNMLQGVNTNRSRTRSRRPATRPALYRERFDATRRMCHLAPQTQPNRVSICAAALGALPQAENYLSSTGPALRLTSAPFLALEVRTHPAPGADPDVAWAAEEPERSHTSRLPRRSSSPVTCGRLNVRVPSWAPVSPGTGKTLLLHAAPKDTT